MKSKKVTGAHNKVSINAKGPRHVEAVVTTPQGKSYSCTYAGNVSVQEVREDFSNDRQAFKPYYGY